MHWMRKIIRTHKLPQWSAAVVLGPLAIAGCKQQTFGNTKSITVVNPDAPQECDVVLSANAPYTAKEFLEKLATAFNNGIKSGVIAEENLRDVLFANDIPSVMKGTFAAETFQLNECGVTSNINASLTKPSYFYWLTGNGRTTNGGMTLYKGDIFAEGFYRNRSSGVEGAIYPRRKYSLAELMKQQLWFEWNKETRSFTAKVGSPALRIAQHIQQDQNTNFLTLHRGTDVTYSSKEKSLAARNSYGFGEYGGIFTTPSYEAAKGWANPVVLTAKLDPREFIAKATAGDPSRGNVPAIYVGIEYGYPEIAFLFAAGDRNNLFFDSITSKCVTEKAQGNDANYAPKCK